MRGTVFLLALALPLASCVRQQVEQPDTTPGRRPGGEERLVGVVRVVGSLPVNVQVVVEPAEGGSVRLVGPLREELQRLAGAEVAVVGELGPAPDPLASRQIRVTGYEILAVDGSPVITGTVEGRMGGWTILRTTSGELLYLSGAGDRLEPGQKVWVQGPRAVVVQSYGVIRP